MKSLVAFALGGLLVWLVMEYRSPPRTVPAVQVSKEQPERMATLEEQGQCPSTGA
jgi:hypothetical protein